MTCCFEIVGDVVLLGPSPAGARSPTSSSLSLAAREGVSTEHLHAERGHARLLRGGYANSEDAGPGYPSSPKEQRDSRGEDWQVR